MMREPAFQLLPHPARTALGGKRVLVLGLGDTGLSAARWSEQHGARVRVADTRSAPPQQFAGDVHLGAFAPALLEGVDVVFISPGLPLADPLIDEALARGLPVLGDVELFAWENRAPVLAITGTNGKSTVTALAGHLLKQAGVDAEVAGNIAPPVLAAAMQRPTPPAAWVLELSSYQLETTWSLNPRAATMLNLSEDHLDRYAGVREYGAAKARLFQGDGVQVLNRDDPASMAMRLPGRQVRTFGLDAENDFGVRDGWLVEGALRIARASSLPLHGAHNSKGTNVGATIAALRGLGRKAVLILGGEGKGQDFSPLRPPVQNFTSRVLLIGRDTPHLEAALAGFSTERCTTLEAAVQRAAEIARPGEVVLLSPACASFDMFRDYKHRGEVFAAAVKALA